MVPECVGHCMYMHVFVFMAMTGVRVCLCACVLLPLFIRILHSKGTYVSAQNGKHAHTHAQQLTLQVKHQTDCPHRFVLFSLKMVVCAFKMLSDTVLYRLTILYT